MSETALTAERVLEAAEDVLRRFGPAKATVVDVARALGVSHGSVYRHFPTKAALRDAVTERWLARIMEPQTAIVEEDGPAAERLHRYLATLSATKRARAASDPELFATYHALVEDAREVVAAHVDHLVGDIARIVADGVASGEFATVDPIATARAILDATSRFHLPVNASTWSDPAIEAAFENVWSLLRSGLSR
ncbi:MAG: TetR family transcriptional regulator [Candidatus Eremiobacteraeota bacterium]|nr:TetR family transcriptional regulator [Candidatus Eremiobacteraeota bacterium]